MKKYNLYWKASLVVLSILGAHLNAAACDACRAQQPKFLQGVTHGAGPTSNWDYAVVIIMVAITLYSFYAMIKCLSKHADKTHENIKNIILNS